MDVEAAESQGAPQKVDREGSRQSEPAGTSERQADGTQPSRAGRQGEDRRERQGRVQIPDIHRPFLDSVDHGTEKSKAKVRHQRNQQRSDHGHRVVILGAEPHSHDLRRPDGQLAGGKEAEVQHQPDEILHPLPKKMVLLPGLERTHLRQHHQSEARGADFGYPEHGLSRHEIPGLSQVAEVGSEERAQGAETCQRGRAGHARDAVTKEGAQGGPDISRADAATDSADQPG